MIAGMEKAIQIGSGMQADANNGQMNFFGSDGFGAQEDLSKDHETLPNVPPWTEMQMLTYEKEVLGFYVTTNPLSKYAETIEVYSNVNTSGLDSKSERQRVVIGGMVASIRHMVTRKGRNAGAKMAVFTLEDLQGNCEVVMFPGVLEEFSDQLEVDRILFVEGRVDRKREKPNIICDGLIALDQACDRLADKVFIRMDSRDVTEKQISRIREICTTHKGKRPVYVNLLTEGGYRVSAVLDKKLSVRPDVEFCRKLESVVGPENVRLTRR
jgi:DNA polymerase-3 subunit alpha